MHIGLVTASYMPVINGVTRMVALYKKHLEAAGHKVTVFTFGGSESGDDFPDVVRSPGFPLRNTGYYFSPRYSPKAQYLLSQVDIIHCHHLVMGLEFAHRYGRSPIVYSNHTRYDLYAEAYLHLPSQMARGFMRLIWPKMLSFSDIVIAPSTSIRQLLYSYGVKQPIEVITNGIETERYRTPLSPLTRQQLGLPENGILMVYVGRLAPEKNLEKLLHEYRISAQKSPSVHLLIIGSGPSQRNLMQLATKLKIEDRVKFGGMVSNYELPRYLAPADIFVTSSRSEVLPLTIIEAMAAGLPVVAINSPGILDLIQDQKSGILAGSQEGDLARAMVSLAGNPNERARMGNSGMQVSQRYHIRRTVDETVLLYDRLLRQSGPWTKEVRQEGDRRYWTSNIS